jgi:hypothetical protein
MSLVAAHMPPYAPHLCLIWPPCISLAYCMCHFTMPLSLHMLCHHTPCCHICHLAFPSLPHASCCYAPHSCMHHFTMPVTATYTTHLAMLISATYATHLAITTTITVAITPQIHNHHHNATMMRLLLPLQHNKMTR